MRLGIATTKFNGLGFGVSNVVVEGVVNTKLDADLKLLPVKNITVSVRCYEFRLTRIGGVVSSKAIVDLTQVLWSKPDGQDFMELGEAEYPFRITIPPRVGGFSTISFVEYRCVWRVEAVVNHAHISGVGSRLIKHIDLPLVRYDLPAFLPLPRSSLHITSSHLDRYITKSRAPSLRYRVSAPKEPIGPTDMLPISIHILPEEPNVSIRSATVVVERRIQFNDSNSPASPLTSSAFFSNTASHLHISSSSAIPIPKSTSTSSLISYAPTSSFQNPHPHSLPSTKSFATPVNSGYASSVSLANDTRPLLPQPKDRSDSSESLAAKSIVLPIAGSESSGPFARTEKGIWSKTLTVQWPSAKPSSRWGIGETIHSDLVSIRFFARVKVVVTSPHSTDSFELEEEEIFVTSTNDAERRLAMSKARCHSSENRSKSKSPRRTRRKRENTADPVPSVTSTSGLKPPHRSPSASRRPHTSAGPRDSSSTNFTSPSSSFYGSEKHIPPPLQLSASSSSGDALPASKKRPASASTISASSTHLTRSNAFGHVISPIVSSTPSSGSSILGSTTIVSVSDLSMNMQAEKEWEAELKRIELKSRRSSDLLGFGLKRKRPSVIGYTSSPGNKPMLQT